jgi:hypothetical protein
MAFPQRRTAYSVCNVLYNSICSCLWTCIMLEHEPNKFREQFTCASHVWWILNKLYPATVHTRRRHVWSHETLSADRPTDRQRMWYARRSTTGLTLFQLHPNTITLSASTKLNKLLFVWVILVSGLRRTEHSWQTRLLYTEGGNSKTLVCSALLCSVLSDNPRNCRGDSLLAFRLKISPARNYELSHRTHSYSFH